jgi:hypothetical protein
MLICYGIISMTNMQMVLSRVNTGHWKICKNQLLKVSILRLFLPKIVNETETKANILAPTMTDESHSCYRLELRLNQSRSVHVNRVSPANIRKKKIKSVFLLSWFRGTPHTHWNAEESTRQNTSLAISSKPTRRCAVTQLLEAYDRHERATGPLV